MLARLIKRLRRSSPAPSARSRRAAISGAFLSLLAMVIAVSFAGCPCVGGVVNASPALRWFLFSNFGASRICPEMLKRGMPIRMQDQAPAIGRYFPMQCSFSVNDSAQTVTVHFAGTGYVYMNPAKRTGFSCTGSVEYRPDFQIVDEDIYVWGRLNRMVQGPNFQIAYVENGILDLAANIPPFGSMANFLGQTVVSGEMTRGFTVVHNEDKGDDFSLGILVPPQKPHHPFKVTNTNAYTFANETTEIHQNQRDFLGPFEITEGGQALTLMMSLNGPPVDVMVVTKGTGDAWRDAYQRGLPHGMGPPPGPIIAGGPLQPGPTDNRRYALAPGLYYVVIDNTSTAGLVSPPTSLFNPLGDAVARVSYVAQLAE
jgi:hypothetical protein